MAGFDFYQGLYNMRVDDRPDIAELIPAIEKLVEFTDRKEGENVFFGVASSIEIERVIFAFLQYCYDIKGKGEKNPFKRNYIAATETYKTEKRDERFSKVPLIKKIIREIKKDTGTTIDLKNVLMIDDSKNKLRDVRKMSDNKVKTYRVEGRYFTDIDDEKIDKIQCQVCDSVALYVTDNDARIPLCGRECLIKYYFQ